MLKIKVKSILGDLNMTQSELSKISGVPAATLSDIINDKRTSINKKHLTSIARALKVSDIRDLVELVDEGGKNIEESR